MKGKKPRTAPNKSGAEKPVSLHGPKFEDVLRALLKTKPQPKEKRKPDGNKKANTNAD